MAKNILIVESPNKISKIKSFLNEDWDVIASFGHIRDLATWGTRFRLGIDLETMEPEYIPLKDKDEVIANIIAKTNEAENIYLAMDPDREGEAIAFHINQVIENKDASLHRITFNELTKESVELAIANPRELDKDLIQSQEARRILDRIIGFRLSYLTNKKISAKSAGRVKSSILKLIIDKEKQIDAFVPDNWFTVEAELSSDESLVNVDKEKYSTIEYKKSDEAILVHDGLTGEFEYVERKESNRVIKAPLPLEMATYLMAMYNSHKTANRAATFAAQTLYEKGLITYPRTDSKRISSKEFIDSTKKYVLNKYDEDHYNGVPIVNSKKSDQDAHEAIRPVNINILPGDTNGLKINEKRAYALIWSTTVKSFMTNGKNKVVNDIYKDGETFFKYKRSYSIEPGFRVVDGVEIANETTAEPKFKIGLNSIEVVPHATKPPGRFNPSSLVKLMKDVGIGRPSTYAGVTSGLIGFGYLEKDDGSLKPTAMANEVNDLLQGHFKDIVNEEYTAGMELSLDKISEGEVNSREYLLEFWKDFEPRVDKADEEIPIKALVYTGKDCPECDEGKLVFKKGRFGEFVSCDRYPECKYSESIHKKKEIKQAGIDCPMCKKPLVIREAGKTKRKFIACSGFPKCKHINPELDTIETLFKLGEITEDLKIKRIEKFEKKLEKETK